MVNPIDPAEMVRFITWHDGGEWVTRALVHGRRDVESRAITPVTSMMLAEVAARRVIALDALKKKDKKP